MYIFITMYNDGNKLRRYLLSLVVSNVVFKKYRYINFLPIEVKNNQLVLKKCQILKLVIFLTKILISLGHLTLDCVHCVCFITLNKIFVKFVLIFEFYLKQKQTVKASSSSNIAMQWHITKTKKNGKTIKII